LFAFNIQTTPFLIIWFGSNQIINTGLLAILTTDKKVEVLNEKMLENKFSLWVY
jgi:hypothetical protein